MMERKLEEWGQDAQCVIEREEFLFEDDQPDMDDNVTNALFSSTSVSEDLMVQELYSCLFKSFTLTVQRMLVDHLPGGNVPLCYRSSANR